MAPPLLAQTNWRYFFRKMFESRQFDWMRSLPSPNVIASIEVPVAVARWIAHFHPEMAAKEHLHIVIGGAELGPDCFDQGAWYKLIPHLLGNPSMRINVSLVGPDALSSTRTGYSGGADELRSVLGPGFTGGTDLLNTAGSVEVFSGTLGAFFEKSADSPDVVILSHPGFEKHAGQWLQPGELPKVLKRGVPVGCLSYAPDEYEHDRWILSKYGYSAIARPSLKNPLAVKEPDALLYSAVADTLWEIDPALPEPEFQPDWVALDQDAARNSALHDAMDPEDLWTIDIVGMEGGYDKDGVPLIYVGFDVLVHPLNGDLYEIDTDSSGRPVGAVATGEVLPAEVLQLRPGDEALPYERKAWALDVLLGLIYLDGIAENELLCDEGGEEDNWISESEAAAFVRALKRGLPA